jgi:DNA-binding XRE family transcriptional regulator
MAQRTGRPPGVTPDGPKIKRLRVGLGLTTAQVAERVGLHPQSVRHAEKGRRISDVFAVRLAMTLGVRVEDIGVRLEDTGVAPGGDIESGAETKIPA